MHLVFRKKFIYFITTLVTTSMTVSRISTATVIHVMMFIRLG